MKIVYISNYNISKLNTWKKKVSLVFILHL